MHCLGLDSPEERQLIYKYIETYPEVKAEVDAVYAVLQGYATISGNQPSDMLKKQILAQLNTIPKISEIPPTLSKNQDVTYWLNYISGQLETPSCVSEIEVKELPSNNNQITYVVWAKAGAIVDETHDSEDEYLLMLKGTCSIIFDGIEKVYAAGDIVFIPKNVAHKAQALSNDMMLVGQRIAR